MTTHFSIPEHERAFFPSLYVNEPNGILSNDFLWRRACWVRTPFSSPHITRRKLPVNQGAGSVSAQLPVLGRRLSTLSSSPDDSEQKLLEEPPELHFFFFF